LILLRTLHSHYYGVVINSSYYSNDFPIVISITTLLNKLPVNSSFVPAIPSRNGCIFRCVITCVAAEQLLSENLIISNCGIILIGRLFISQLIYFNSLMPLSSDIRQYINRWGYIVLASYARLQEYHLARTLDPLAASDWLIANGFSYLFYNGFSS